MLPLTLQLTRPKSQVSATCNRPAHPVTHKPYHCCPPRCPPHHAQFRWSLSQVQDVWLTAKDGVKLHAWFMWPKDWAPEAVASKPTIVFFQENAGNMSWRLPFLRMLSRYLDCSILAPRCVSAAGR